MQAAPTTALPLVHIAAPAGSAAPLSAAQQEFNHLTQRIAGLEQDVRAFREAATTLRRRVQDEYRPLQARHNEQRAALVRALDHAHAHYKLSATERGQLARLIAQGGHDLPQKGFPELQALLNQYAPPAPPAAEVAARDQAAAERLQELFSTRYGIRFDPAAALRTPAQVEAYVRRQLEAEQAATEAARQARAERRARRPPKPRQQAAAARQQVETRRSTQAVRTLYLDLVKHLHPDREPDEAEKTRKTELLKQVTTAYDAGELLTLLRLQLELNRIDHTHLERLADEQLRYYNALLRGQAQELGQALRDEQRHLAAYMGRPLPTPATPHALHATYEQQQRQLQHKIQQLATQVPAFAQDPAALKGWLKAQRG